MASTQSTQPRKPGTPTIPKPVTLHYNLKKSQEEAAKASVEKTKLELEKLQESIKQTNAFHDNDYKNPSDIESSDNTDDDDDDDGSDSEEDSRRIVTRKNKSVNMDIRMYNDNQKLWKKNQKLKIELERTNKALRYLKLDHNNKCIDITSLSEEKKIFKKDKLFMKNIVRTFMIRLYTCYFIIIIMTMNYTFNIPIYEYLFSQTKLTFKRMAFVELNERIE